MNDGPEQRAAAAIGIGNRLAPARFLLFLGVMALAVPGWHALMPGSGWREAMAMGFDAAAIAFVVSLWPLRKDHTVAQMRRHASENDANRALVLAITALVALSVLAAIAGELPAAQKGSWPAIAKLVGTLALSWVFVSLVFMLHYAHMHYAAGAGHGRHAGKGECRGGFEFPGTPDPDYLDFLYFAFTAGMSFAVSDVQITRGAVRRVVMAQCLLSFVFNIGVIAFSINVLAGSA